MKRKHDPDAKLDYSVDWSDWLAAGETIVSAAWTVPDGLTQGDPYAASATGTVATVWISGGTAGTEYVITCHVVTSAGREDDRSITLSCEER